MNESINTLAELLEQAATILRKIAKEAEEPTKVYLDAELVGQVIAGKAKRDNPGASEGPSQKKPE